MSMTQATSPAETGLHASAPRGDHLGLQEASALASAAFDLSPHTIVRLVSERDQNFHIITEAGAEYLLKISNAKEDVAYIAFQAAAMAHITAIAPDLPIQRLRPTSAGKLHFMSQSEPPRIARLMTYLPGIVLQKVVRTAELRKTLGATLAELGLALREFEEEQPSSLHLLWDMQRAPALRELSKNVARIDIRDLALRALDRFESYAEPILKALPRQVIHNDFNLHNVLVSADATRVTGILDFGDMIRAPVVCDLSIGAAYQAELGDDTLGGILDFVGGYSGVRALNPAEVSILPDLIMTRMAATILITQTNAQRFPENRDYILRNFPIAEAGLRHLSCLPRADAVELFRGACKSFST